MLKSSSTTVLFLLLFASLFPVQALGQTAALASSALESDARETGAPETVTLEAAIAAARSAGPQVQGARARAEAAQLGVIPAGAFRWPRVGFEGTAVRSQDPVAAFGGRLRQGRFTVDDFDPSRLNAPAPLTDWSGVIGVQWTPVDLASLSGLEAARAGAQGAQAEQAWIERAAGFEAEVRYLEAVGASVNLTATQAAREASEAHLAVIERRVIEGLLNEVDLFQARAALEGARALEHHANQRLADARGRLALAMGWSVDRTPVPADETFDAHATQGAAHGAAPGAAPPAPLALRPDLQAAAAAVLGADALWQGARRARLPRVEGFVQGSTHSPELFSSPEAHWTLGARVSIPIFTGFQLRARIEQAEALRTAAQFAYDEAHRLAETEQAEALRRIPSAERRRAASTAAAEAAEEATRLARRRFEEGLMTPSDLLAVEARAAAARSDAIHAGLDEALAHAWVRFLSPTDLAGTSR